MDEQERILSECRSFRGLPGELLAGLRKRMREHAYESGERLIRQADPGNSLQLLLEGRAGVVVVEGVDEPTEVAEVGVGDVIGEMALISGEPTSADVVARTPVRVLELMADDFHAMARKHPEIAVVLTRLVAERLGRARADALGGKLVRGYKILRCVGRGGMAVVYEALHEGDGERVALKMMSHRLTYDTTALSRFREETQLLQTLDHTNIVGLLGRFSAYGTHFVVIEFCDGPALDGITERRVPIDEKHVRPVTGQIARALEYVHQRGFLHRDIKPSNAMLTKAGALKLIDFGVARPIRQHDDRTQTLETSVVGTPFYMAPEQLEETTDIDERVDSYALACMTYEFLAGARLFKKDTNFGILRQKLNVELPPRQTIGNGISEEMDQFLRCNLQPGYGERSRSLAAQAAWAEPANVEALTEAAS